MPTLMDDWGAVEDAIRDRMRELAWNSLCCLQSDHRSGNGRGTRMTARTDQQKKTVTSGERQQPSISQQEKARRWDSLICMLRRPEIRNTGVRQLSSQRRAVLMLLASREELPASLTAELKSYKATLDALYFEAIDGFAAVDGVINFLPTYITESLVGELCQPDSTDNDECS